jgi:hypothetical protein
MRSFDSRAIKPTDGEVAQPYTIAPAAENAPATPPKPTDGERTTFAVAWSDVRDPETGEVHPAAAEHIDSYGGYTEITPDGYDVRQYVTAPFGADDGDSTRVQAANLDDELFTEDAIGAPAVTVVPNGYDEFPPRNALAEGFSNRMNLDSAFVDRVLGLTTMRFADGCIVCGEGDELVSYTFYDRSGGVDVSVCEFCHDALIERRLDLDDETCVMCGDDYNATHGRSKGLAPDYDPSGGYTVCGACRDELLFGVSRLGGGSS